MTPHSSGSIVVVNLYSCICTEYGNINALDTLHIEAYLYLHRFANRIAHGKGTETGHQARGAGERLRAQPAPGGHSRRLVHWEPRRRCEGAGSGALRDGAAASRRWRRNQRGLDQFRRLAAHLLQGPEGASKGRAAWPAAEPARSQRWPQDLCRGRCLCGRSQGCKLRVDNLAMSQGGRDTVWHKGAPAELGARAGAQKKTNPSGLTVAAAPQAADAYESLRAAVLCAEPTACPGLGILHRQGLSSMDESARTSASCKWRLSHARALAGARSPARNE